MASPGCSIMSIRRFELREGYNADGVLEEMNWRTA